MDQAMQRFTQDLITDPTQVMALRTYTQEEWAEMGRALGHAERVLGWAVGSWFNAGERFDRESIVQQPGWSGPSLKTCRLYAEVDAKFQLARRLEILPFSHHAEVARLAPAVADRLLKRAAKHLEKTGELLPSRQLRQWAKAERRSQRETELADATEQASTKVGNKLYSVIYADPPWQFDPRSRESGMDRSPDNHYPTMTTDDICSIDVPAAKDCALFLWRTAPMLLDAIRVMEAWGFAYKTEWVWAKPYVSTGYWNRNRHEVLMLGVKGHVPAPAPGEQFDSLIPTTGKERHSQKPAVFIQMIDEMFPSQRGLEMFARSGYEGWDYMGNEV